MGNSKGARFPFLRAALLCTTALILLNPGIASARVGVTSATDGDPLGKPPAEPQRVLRIGIDVQADEIITTSANDRAHLVFLDGTSLTVGPNAELKIDKFVYDPNTKTGELAVSATKGVLRLVGGRISKTNPITITTPSSTIGIRGGIVLLHVMRDRTTATMGFGNNMSVRDRLGHVVNVTRPGMQVSTLLNAASSQPTLVGQGQLTGQMNELEGKSNSQSGGSGGGQGGAGGPGSGQGQGQTQQANAAEQGAQNFGKGNSGQGPSGGPPGGPGGPTGPGNKGGNSPANNLQNNAQNVVTNAVSNGGQQGQKNGGANPNTNTSNSTTTVIVSKGTLGRYLADPIYTGFNNTNLGVTITANNYRALTSPSDVTTNTTTTTTTRGGNTTTTTTTGSTISINVPNVGSINLPWKTDTMSDGFSIDNMNALNVSLKNGRGYVSANGDFFAYIFETTGNNKVGLFGGTPTNTSGTSGFPTTGFGTFTVGNLGNPGQLPFANQDIGGNADLKNAKIVSSLYTAWSTTLASTIGSPIPDGRASALQASISISGTGNNQKSYLGVFIGQFLRDIDVNSSGTVTRDNGQYLAGNFSATYRTSSNFNTDDGKIGTLTANEATPNSGAANSNNVGSDNKGNAIYGSAGSLGLILTPDQMTSSNAGGGGGGNVTGITTSRTFQAAYQQPYTNLSGSDYYSVTGAYQTTTPSSVGTSRTNTNSNSTQLRGYVGGVVEQVDQGGTFSTRAVTSTDPSNFSLKTDPSVNRASAEFTVSNWDTSTSATFKLGSTTSSNVSTSAFIDDNIYALRDRPSSIGAGSTEIGGSATGVTSNTFIVSYNTAAADSLFTNAGVTKCTCAFLTWGWWSGDIAYGSTSAYNAQGRDRLNLATYVAGTLAQSTQLPLTGSATYSGMLWGNVADGNRQYLQAGSYSNNWNFGSRTGATSVSFDGTNFSGNTSASTGSVNFSGSITQGSKTLNLNGSFVGSGTPPAGQMGSFSITGTNYKAAGSFAAQKQ